MMLGRNVLTVVLLAVLAVGPAWSDDTPVRYDGHKVVRVTVDSHAQLEQLQALDLLLLSDFEWLGQIDYVVPPECLDTFHDLGLDFKVLDEDIQATLDAERARLEARLPVDPRDRGWFDDYKTFDEINQFLDAWVATYPDMVSKYQIGTSWENRPIYGLTISGPVGNPDDKPALCFNGLLHAREWISPTTVLYFMDRLLDEYDSDPIVKELLDKMTFYVSPLTNPDGYVYTWTPNNRLWRKNRRDNGGGVYGVDLNRNWATGWGGQGSSGSPSSDTYRGPSAFSEPETQALRDYILAHPNIVGHIDFHSYGQLVMWPWGYKTEEPPEPDRSILRGLGADMVDAIYSVHSMQYTDQPSYELYLAAGISIDWVYEQADAFSFTIELRNKSSFILPPDQIIPTGEENYAAVRVLAEFFTLLLKIEFPGGLPSMLIPDVPQDVLVSITELGGQLDPNSPTLHYRVGNSGPFAESPLTALGGGQFRATLPGTPCGKTLEYYFSARTTNQAVVLSPPDAPNELYRVEALPLKAVLNVSMDTDPGWATEGQWAWGQPTGQGGNHGSPDPTRGYTGDNVYGYNLNGDYANNMPQYHLTTGAFDCTDLDDVRLGFWRWLGVERYQYDKAVLRISTDGSNWNVVWQNPDAETADGDWTYVEYDISAWADNQPAVQLRWTMGETDVGWTYCGWNIDDVKVWGLDPNGCLKRGDLNCDDQVDFGDINPFVLALTDPQGYANAFPDCDIMAGDINEDGKVDFNDINPFVTLLTNP